jgi:uncharacterized protein YdhG (YjbR/CyaY superfamily)
MGVRFGTVDEYIGSFPDDVQVILEDVRRTIHEAVPGAAEKISYNLPAITLSGRDVIAFAAWKHHLSIYPIPAADGELARELAPYKASKGTLKFPYAGPIPYDLIGRVARLLAEQRANA